MKVRLDKKLVELGLSSNRSQADNFIRLGLVKVNSKPKTKSGLLVGDSDEISMDVSEQYVSRAGLKLASVAEALKLDFRDKIVLDVGSSTGGFTDFALQHGAKKVIAVDVGTDQLHPSLRSDARVEVHEKTDIREFRFRNIDLRMDSKPILNSYPDIVLIDVSFISLREILPHISLIVSPKTLILAMVKPQFEAGREQVNKGVIKNDRLRRQILKDFETWAKRYFIIKNKADSKVAGTKGNLERFYLLKMIKRNQ